MTNTALSAKVELFTRNITFENEEHERFFYNICSNTDMRMHIMCYWCIA